MNGEDYDLLLQIINRYVIQFKYDYQLDLDHTEAEKDWLRKHGEYVQTNIYNKLIDIKEVIK